MDTDKATISQPADILTVSANNPSPMTGPGTNSYVLHGEDAAIVIDPGPDDPAHLEALLCAIGPRKLNAIVVTHAHLDHSALARRLSDKTQAPIMAYGGATSGRHPTIERLVKAGMQMAGEGADVHCVPDVLLCDGDEIAFGQGGLRVLHTPGHMGGHICLALGSVLFSGDHVMAWAPSLIAPPDGHMRDYMTSLRRLMASDWTAILPGHGPRILNTSQRLEDLWQHRKAREQAIVSALAIGPATPRDLTAALYSAITPALWPAAELSVVSHLIDLHERSLVNTANGFQTDSLFHLI